LPSRDVAVGHLATAFSKFCGWSSGRSHAWLFHGIPFSARGVGHIFATTVSEVGFVRGPPFMRAFIAKCASGDF
jgi:hypothetical protein